MIEPAVLAGILILVRVSSFLAAVPMFSARNLPRTVKVGLAVALTALWLGRSQGSDAVMLEQDVSADWLGFALLFVGELILGVVLGMAFGIFTYPPRIAGAYVAQEMGLTMASVMDGSQSESTSIVASVFEAFAILLFFGLNCHHLLFLVLNVSLERIPIGVPLHESGYAVMAETFGQIDGLGIRQAAPMVILLFSGTVFLLIINRISPTLNLFSLGLSLRILAGLLALCLLFPYICAAIESSFARAADSISKIVESCLR